MANHPNRRRLARHNYDVSLGDVVFLVENIDLSSDKSWLSVTHTMPTNNAGIECETGLLGTYNNVTRYARGRVELTKWGSDENTVMFGKAK